MITCRASGETLERPSVNGATAENPETAAVLKRRAPCMTRTRPTHSHNGDSTRTYLLVATWSLAFLVCLPRSLALQLTCLYLPLYVYTSTASRMARPAEKARAMMNRWVAMRDAGNAPQQTNRKRPHLASECEHLADADKFRGQIIREITAGIAKIQNPGLGEHAIRELNDEINRKMREKWHWNRRIKELGGADYNAIEKKRQIEEGDTQMNKGYRYFGAAKDLPGVKELLAKEAAKRHKGKRSDIYKNITPDYYGWRDEEDGVLLELEAAATRENERALKKRRIAAGETDESVAAVPVTEDADYLDVPSQDEIGQILLEQKKKALLSKYSL